MELWKILFTLAVIGFGACCLIFMFGMLGAVQESVRLQKILFKDLMGKWFGEEK